MKLVTFDVEIEYKGALLCCEKTVYGCDHCDFQLHLGWMKEKMQKDLEKAYLEKNSQP